MPLPELEIDRPQIQRVTDAYGSNLGVRTEAIFGEIEGPLHLARLLRVTGFSASANE